MEITQKVKDFLTFDLGEIHLEAFGRKQLEVCYMEKGTKTFDLYLPDGDGPFPLLLVVHGGGWISGHHRSKFVEQMTHPIRHGIAVACIQYTLALEKPFPQQIYDIKTAIRYFHANADLYPIDPAKIFLWGESAGAHLAALSALTLDSGQFEDRSLGFPSADSSIAGVIAHYGVYDFMTMDDQLGELGYENDWPMTDDDSLASWLIGGPFNDHLDIAYSLSPQNHVHKTSFPFFLRHGKGDSMVPWYQTRDFAQALIEAGCTVDLDYIDDANHAEFVFFDEEQTRKIADFVFGVK